MTAVEYLVSKIASKIYDEYWSNQQDITEYVEQAKEMEKQQISKSWDDGNYGYFYSKETGKDLDNGEQYYNETFKK